MFGPSRKSAVRKTGVWRLGADETAPEDLDGQVHQVLRRLTQEIAVWHLLSRRYRVDLFCGWFMGTANEGVVVAPETLRALGARNITLSIDIYAPGP